MRIVQLTPDLLRLVPLASYQETMAQTVMAPGVIEMVTRPDLGYGMIDGGYIIGAGGVAPVWHGRAVAWLIAGIWARPRHFAFARRHALALFDRIQGDPAFRRIECQVNADLARGFCFVEQMGFTRETPEPMRAWGLAADDYYQFARVA